MSTVMLMEWNGLTQDQYTQVMRTLDLDKNPASGGIFHVAGFAGGTLHVLDIWDSQQSFERFQKNGSRPPFRRQAYHSTASAVLSRL